ncbi:hemagglutinin repeat-containing protein [Erwinia sp. INIA-01]|uniref:hemagglutinin repeat-containing protein n=1 Tax=Erwinia sp. INIA01 TaxID=2991500 RepID=UPI0022251908|nr:hemagglutinin repeat-containing protein [Erwinia sp. INIA01]MCW1877823.1 hemagglutinin repeat-containing protein [Erwinia sp. INIA01]
MNLRAADVTATGDATLLAGNNLNLTSGEAGWDQSSSAKWKKHGLMSKTTTKIQSETHQQSALGSTVSGETLKVMAGNDLTTSGSNLLGTNDVTLSAGNNLNLTSGEAGWDQSTSAKWKKHGFLSKTTTKIQSETHQQSALGSTVSGDTLKVMAG